MVLSDRIVMRVNNTNEYGENETALKRHIRCKIVSHKRAFDSTIETQYPKYVINILVPKRYLSSYIKDEKNMTFEYDDVVYTYTTIELSPDSLYYNITLDEVIYED